MTPTTHDFSRSTWGHAISSFDPQDGGQSAHAIGHGHGIKSGDYLILSHPNGGTTRYAVDMIEYYSDPRDMWRARLVYAPREAQRSRGLVGTTRGHIDESGRPVVDAWR